MLESDSSSAKNLGTAGAKTSPIQSVVPGTRLLLHGASRYAAGDRRVLASRKSQPSPDHELGDAGTPVPHSWTGETCDRGIGAHLCPATAAARSPASWQPVLGRRFGCSGAHPADISHGWREPRGGIAATRANRATTQGPRRSGNSAGKCAETRAELPRGTG